jgi:hypothetical protein
MKKEAQVADIAPLFQFQYTPFPFVVWFGER